MLPWRTPHNPGIYARNFVFGQREKIPVMDHLVGDSTFEVPIIIEEPFLKLQYRSVWVLRTPF